MNMHLDPAKSAAVCVGRLLIGSLSRLARLTCVGGTRKEEVRGEKEVGINSPIEEGV